MSLVPGLTDLDLKLASAEVSLSTPTPNPDPKTPQNESLGGVMQNGQELPPTENGGLSELEVKTPMPISQKPVSGTHSAPSKRGRKRKGEEDHRGVLLPAVQNPAWLPNKWRVKTIIRDHGKSAGSKDTYYIEEETKHQFRSKKEVLEYLATGVRRPNKRLKNGDETVNAAPLMISEPSSESGTAPEKVTWAFENSGESFWMPFIAEARVPEHIRLAWAAMYNPFSAEMTATNLKR